MKFPKPTARPQRLPHAEPGFWYGEYHGDWTEAHPDRRQTGHRPGAFYAGDIWSSTDLEWDRQWFLLHGWQLPERTQAKELIPGQQPAVIIDRLIPGQNIEIYVDREA